jgi:hypothetical protein
MSGKGLFYVLAGRRLIGTFNNIKPKEEGVGNGEKEKSYF